MERKIGQIVKIKMPNTSTYGKYRNRELYGEVTKNNRKTDEITVWVFNGFYTFRLSKLTNK